MIPKTISASDASGSCSESLQIIRDLDEVSEKFSLSSEENILLKGELSSENEISRSKIDELQDQCQKLLRQNSSVLKSMATLEHDLEKG